MIEFYCRHYGSFTSEIFDFLKGNEGNEGIICAGIHISSMKTSAVRDWNFYEEQIRFAQDQGGKNCNELAIL